MISSERKYKIIKQIAGIQDEAILSELEDWLTKNISGEDEMELTPEGERELLRRIKQYEETPGTAVNLDMIMQEMKAKYGL